MKSLFFVIMVFKIANRQTNQDLLIVFVARKVTLPDNNNNKMQDNSNMN